MDTKSKVAFRFEQIFIPSLIFLQPSLEFIRGGSECASFAVTSQRGKTYITTLNTYPPTERGSGGFGAYNQFHEKQSN